MSLDRGASIRSDGKLAEVAIKSYTKRYADFRLNRLAATISKELDPFSYVRSPVVEVRHSNTVCKTVCAGYCKRLALEL